MGIESGIHRLLARRHARAVRRLVENPPPDGLLLWDPSTDSQTYVDGRGQKVLFVHPPAQCEGRPCAIHRPSQHLMRGFPTLFRGDRHLMERVCPHGVGHPDPDDLAWHVAAGREWQGIHGCDGCCQDPLGKERL